MPIDWIWKQVFIYWCTTILSSGIVACLLSSLSHDQQAKCCFTFLKWLEHTFFVVVVVGGGGGGGGGALV
jgi:hypothetical protein